MLLPKRWPAVPYHTKITQSPFRITPPLNFHYIHISTNMKHRWEDHAYTDRPDTVSEASEGAALEFLCTTELVSASWSSLIACDVLADLAWPRDLAPAPKPTVVLSDGNVTCSSLLKLKIKTIPKIKNFLIKFTKCQNLSSVVLILQNGLITWLLANIAN